MKLDHLVPASWRDVLSDELNSPYFHALDAFVAREREEHTVFPPQKQVFAALEATPFEKAAVVLLGQDPYHDDGQAHGLCFSVPKGVKPPPSLANIFKERKSDLALPIPPHGYLMRWATQGVLMLNTVLTVRAHQANSHKGKGWERFTDAIIRAVNDRDGHAVFVLWGAHAQKKRAMIDMGRHVVIESAHPSPLSARNGFFGSRPFSRINTALEGFGAPQIDWRIEGEEA